MKTQIHPKIESLNPEFFKGSRVVSLRPYPMRILQHGPNIVSVVFNIWGPPNGPSIVVIDTPEKGTPPHMTYNQYFP